ncbi:hypothetical protein AB3Y40_18590 [Yoonia sp. R2331]|uniref:hypothetical protein n=1 Tax=Yoonia sp. R2331 TaxID=3237238 RepID=UPI0034E3D51E
MELPGIDAWFDHALNQSFVALAVLAKIGASRTFAAADGQVSNAGFPRLRYTFGVAFYVSDIRRLM